MKKYRNCWNSTIDKLNPNKKFAYYWTIQYNLDRRVKFWPGVYFLTRNDIFLLPWPRLQEVDQFCFSWFPNCLFWENGRKSTTLNTMRNRQNHRKLASKPVFGLINKIRSCLDNDNRHPGTATIISTSPGEDNNNCYYNTWSTSSETIERLSSRPRVSFSVSKAHNDKINSEAALAAVTSPPLTFYNCYVQATFVVIYELSICEYLSNLSGVQVLLQIFIFLWFLVYGQQHDCCSKKATTRVKFNRNEWLVVSSKLSTFSRKYFIPKSMFRRIMT